MSAIAAPTTPASPARVPQPAVDPGQSVVLDNVSWSEYEVIGEALRDRPNLRLTYDRGRLEIMTLSQEHERFKYLIGRLIDVLAEETGTRVEGFGSTTYKRDAAERGLEPDQCYYTRNFDRVRGLRRIDLARDPPPDFAVEIDVTHSSLDRMGIYAALGIPEVWRLEGTVIRLYLLNADGRYEPADRSPTFPAVPVTDLVPFLQRGFTDGSADMVRAVRAWVRNLPPRP
ncbi:MAG TPA: Uma2 family endonuclease [Gemmataceae bacterium]|jgi:Uma2 family endonuclease